MIPLAIDVTLVVDNGPTVTLIGTDQNTGANAAIRIDLRPYEAILKELRRTGLSKAAYAASGLTVSLEFKADRASSFGGGREH